jgi:hypothetical protein
MQIPDTWPSLQHFAEWYTENNYPIRVPENVTIYPTDISYSCCVFRQDVYQVEIYLGKPNFTSSKHSHPFDQLIIFLGGHLTGIRQGGTLVGNLGGPITSQSSKEKPHKDFGNISNILTAKNWHEVTGKDQGFIFFNLQKWPDKSSMTSAVVEYIGDSLGTLHDIIQKQE